MKTAFKLPLPPVWPGFYVAMLFQVQTELSFQQSDVWYNYVAGFDCLFLSSHTHTI